MLSSRNANFPASYLRVRHVDGAMLTSSRTSLTLESVKDRFLHLMAKEDGNTGEN